jgi:hypothetical protein
MKVTEGIMALRAIVRITCRAKRFNFTLYQLAITLTYAVLTGHRAGHLVQHARRQMTGSVAGQDGGVPRVILSAGWYYSVAFMSSHFLSVKILTFSIASRPEQLRGHVEGTLGPVKNLGHARARTGHRVVRNPCSE